MQRDCGARAEVLPATDFAALAPGFRTDDLTLAAWEPDGGYGDGALVAGDLLAAARERGVRYRPHTPVLALLREGDRVTGIQTPDGPEHAQVVVAAAGVWSPALLASIGVDLPIETEFHQVAVLSHAPGQGTPVACIDSTTQSYFRPEAGGSMTLVGSFTGPRGVDPDTRRPPTRRPPRRIRRWRSARWCVLRRRRRKTHHVDGLEGRRGWRSWWGRRRGGCRRWATRGLSAGLLACTT